MDKQEEIKKIRKLVQNRIKLKKELASLPEFKERLKKAKEKYEAKQ